MFLHLEFLSDFEAFCLDDKQALRSLDTQSSLLSRCVHVYNFRFELNVRFDLSSAAPIRARIHNQQVAVAVRLVRLVDLNANAKIVAVHSGDGVCAAGKLNRFLVIECVNQPQFVADWLSLRNLALAHCQDATCLVDKRVFNRHLRVVGKVAILLCRQVVRPALTAM